MRAGKHIFAGLWILIAGMVTYLAMGIYFHVWYQHPSVRWSEAQYKVVEREIKQGDPIIFRINERCTKDEYRVSINREIVDSISYTIPQSNVTFPKGCTEDLRIVPNVTAVLPPGDDYYLSNNLEVTVRWWFFTRIDKYQTRTETFTILPK